MSRIKSHLRKRLPCSVIRSAESSMIHGIHRGRNASCYWVNTPRAKGYEEGKA